MSWVTLERRASDLAAARAGFVEATVVRARRPTSSRAGDRALVLADGTIEGFVGGVCAESTVRLQALRCLETGESVLLRILPESDETADEAVPVDGAVTAHNPCLSQGALEIFLEPRRPDPRLVVLGASPIAAALADLAQRVGFDVQRADAGPLDDQPDDTALVVASHGRDEEDALAEALSAGLPYVALVASEVRGAAVRDALPVSDTQRARLRSPAGLRIGAQTPAEIALAILAEIVAERRARSVVEPASAPALVAAGAADSHCCEH